MKFRVTSFHLILIIMAQVAAIAVLVYILISDRQNADNETQAYDAGNIKVTALKEYDRLYLQYSHILPRTEYPFLKYLRTSFNGGEGVSQYKLPLKPMAEDEFIATAYDLSFESCGKYPSHPEYGITFSGKKALKGRTIAVDPKVIPLGSKVHMTFPDNYRYLNGWYIAEDTGRLVKGKIIDVFFGESAFYEMETFGSRIVKVKIVYPEYY